jgi:hypothetical protein
MTKYNLHENELIQMIVCSIVDDRLFTEDFDGTQVNIELKINGVEYDFGVFSQHLIESYDERVRQDAEELLEKKFGKVSQAATDIQNLLDDCEENIKSKLWED